VAPRCNGLETVGFHDACVFKIPSALEPAMSQALRHPLTDLRRGATLRIDDGQPHVIDVFEGLVWVTQDGDPRDVILEAGESFRFDGPGLTLVQAFDDARVLLTDLVETPRSINALALHRRARAQRDAAVAALIGRAFAAAESGVQRLVERLTHRPLRPSNAPV
jgi:hypothetical protein